MQAVNGIGATNGTYGNGGNGGDGIIRLESNTLIGWVTGNTTPAYTFGLPGHVLVPNSPTLVISSVTPSIGRTGAGPCKSDGKR